MKHDSPDWSASHMKRYLQCAEQQRWPSNITKYCACHAKWLSRLIRVTYETLLTYWQSNRCHPPTSPNTAPAAKNDFHEWSSSHMKRYLQCAEQQVSSSNITEYCDCHAKWPSKIWQEFLHEASFTMRDRSDRDPTMIRPQNRQSATRLASEVTFRTRHEHFVVKNTALQLSVQLTKCCTCHEKWHLNFTK